jgi:hypothetical protein
MESLTAANVVRLWEEAADELPAARSLTLLAEVSPALPVEELAIGEVDRGLLELWELTFGPHLDAFVECPSCREPLELTLDARELLAAEAPTADVITVSDGAWTIELRPLRSGDLVAVGGLSREEARRVLLLASVIALRREGEEAEPCELPEHLVERVTAALETCDPLAEVRIDLLCPACHHAWSALFDAGTFLWAEVGLEAERILGEVHALASAYGWRERDVLALSPTRRQFYLEAIG